MVRFFYDVMKDGNLFAFMGFWCFFFRGVARHSTGLVKFSRFRFRVFFSVVGCLPFSGARCMLGVLTLFLVVMVVSVSIFFNLVLVDGS